ncbi:NAD(P)/FAD-dependent oxidoreductase [Chloroflexota bacterium]
MHDVIVVGGGPVGSRVSGQLAGMGHRVLAVDEKEDLGGQICCTGIVSRECVSSFAIGGNVISQQLGSAKFFSPSAKVLRLWREEPQACVVDRAAFNVALARWAQDKGVEYVLDSSVRGIEVGNDRVRVEVTGRGERVSFLEAQAVVIATGSSSRLAEGLGLGRFGDFVAGAQAEVEVGGLEEVEVYFGQDIAPGFFAWLVPTSPGRALVGLLSRRRPGFFITKLISSLQAQGKIVSCQAELNYGGVSLKPLSRTYRDRLIVVGTAAGQVKPTTGGGIYYGLLCADVAASCLNRALEREDLSNRSLASYEREWKKKLGWELRIGYRARKLYEQLSDRQLDRIFDIIKDTGIDETLLRAEDLSFDWHAKAVLRLMGHWALLKIIGVKMLSFF